MTLTISPSRGLRALVFTMSLAGCASRTSGNGQPAPPETVSTSAEADTVSPEAEPAAWRFEGPALSGKNCGEEALPVWVFDGATRRATLSVDPSVVFEVPPDWSAELEQPGLLVLRAPASRGAFRPTFELFIGPVCESFEGPAVCGRIAARAWADLREPTSTFVAVREGRWPAALGGIGQSLILEVELDTPGGPQEASLYFTEYGRGETFAIFGAAACPGRIPPVATEGPCQSAYRAMLR